VCWKWKDARNTREFPSEAANTLARGFQRYLHLPHRFICITDDFHGLDRRLVQPIEMPATGFESLINPSEKTQNRRGGDTPKRFPSCYRRLWNFSQEAREVLGPLILATDIDTILTGPIDPLVQRHASFVGWCDVAFEAMKCAGGLYLLRTGMHTDVWTRFDPERSPAQAKKVGLSGSDQAWMSYVLYPPADVWTRADGLWKLRWLKPHERAPPAGARMIFTSGEHPPWDPAVQKLHPWIRDYWM
jgi:hypothetical protein